jgi:hypothetical protein
MRSFNAASRSVAGGAMPAAASASVAVSIARLRTDVYSLSTRRPRSFSPAARASSSPFDDRGTSTHPVNRFSRFHWDWP